MTDTLRSLLDEDLHALRLIIVDADGGTDTDDTLKAATEDGKLRVTIEGLAEAEGPLTWAALTLQNSWVNYDGANYANAQYAKDAKGLVHLRGVIKDGTTAAFTLLATLPVGFRPTKRHVFVSASSGGVAVLDVLANGQILYASGGGSGYLTMCGITFDTQ